jgi:hypothetical protein
MRNLLFTSMLVGLSSLAASADQLTDLRWKARVLVLSAPTANHGDMVAQRLILAKDAQGLVERDIRIVELVSEKDAELRDKLKLAPGRFTVVLLGKDGEEKMRDGRPVTLDALFGLIDAMPMRKREMREPR